MQEADSKGRVFTNVWQIIARLLVCQCNWTAICAHSANREGHTDDAADWTLIIIYSTVYDGQNRWRAREKIK